ncbi:amidohydrolase family protein [Catenuloplanes indicus]|uniref:TIM-barrel fold metal-dependent hydrolase n=1 Tax=Catenuloplanes indicus TaxID=137267 RepID=A0AAE3VVE5_9ACTN|nr:amidohydrolase family protein [Catenuloplanes indicus]MDQ0364370.1 putative TIM-barrel fold metal-dependent hydrolase [Catenuloplanes indicus]
MTARIRIVGLEEHIALPLVLDAWEAAGVAPNPHAGWGDTPFARRLRSTGEERLADMDDQGIDAAVLSLNSPGVQNLARADAPAVARDANDALAAIVSEHPDRLDAWAAIPTQDPAAATAELERAVTRLKFKGAMLYGRTGTALADSPEFDDLYATAARLRVPLHFHPQVPAPAVMESYYSGLGPAGPGLGTAGLGWYYDLGVQYLRMIFSGVFDRHSDLQVVAGHWGELVLFYLDHTGILAHNAHLERPLLDYFTHHFWIAGSGTVSERYLRWTAEVVGTARMVYSTDYPYTFGTRPGGFPYLDTANGVARSFLESVPFSDEEKTAIGAGNWERLTAFSAAG